MKIPRALVTVLQVELDLEIIENYAGVNMRGKTCFAVVGGPQDLAKLLLNIRDYTTRRLGIFDADDHWTDTVESWQSVRWNGRGSELVFYWPDITVEEVRDGEPGQAEHRPTR